MESANATKTRVIVKIGAQRSVEAAEAEREPEGLGLEGQANKRIRWMPWRPQAMKDVAACEKLRGAGK
jgi:hypothetical protein